MYAIKFRAKGNWFWRTLQCQGQQYLANGDKLVIKKQDGTYHEIPEASKTEFKYGQDLLDALNKKPEEEKQKA